MIDYSGALEWVNFIHRPQADLYDVGWCLEHVHHFLGDPVPLVRTSMITVFESGGLFFLWIPENVKLYVVHPGPALEDIMEAAGTIPATLLEEDPLAYNISMLYENLRTWELMEHKRNRWEELKARGGDVDDNLLKPLTVCAYDFTDCWD